MNVTMQVGDTLIHVKQRAIVVVGVWTTTKIFTDPAVCAHELSFYKKVPWAAPRLIDRGVSHFVTPTYPTAEMLPDWRPARELLALLQRIHHSGVAHRDVHVKNIVRGPDGEPLLIDWETATLVPRGFLSYDLYGPGESGLPIPEIHEGLVPQWVNSDEDSSIRNMWGVDLPELLEGSA